MTDPSRPRWTAAQKREARDARRGKEQRTDYRGQREDRRFSVGVTTSPSVRTSSSSNSNAATVVGAPVVYGTPYTVYDAWGSFIEVVQAGAISSILATADCRFLYNHQGLTMARTSSGTLTLTDTPHALNCSATLDPRQTVASDLVLAIGRGDVNQMSVGFVVAEDSWNEDFSYRTITRFGELMDVSPVAFPASPTTSVEVLDVPEHLLPDAGPDGTTDAPSNGSQDGTGRSKPDVALLLQIDKDALRLNRPPLRRRPARCGQRGES